MHGIILCLCGIVFHASPHRLAVAAAVVSWPCNDVCLWEKAYCRGQCANAYTHEFVGGSSMVLRAARGGGGGGAVARPSFPVRSATTTSSLSAANSMPFLPDGANVIRVSDNEKCSLTACCVTDITDVKRCTAIQGSSPGLASAELRLSQGLQHPPCNWLQVHAELRLHLREQAKRISTRMAFVLQAGMGFVMSVPTLEPAYALLRHL